MNLLIARSNFHSYSETFIDEQIKQLAPAEVLYEGWLPSRTYSGKSILTIYGISNRYFIYSIFSCWGLYCFVAIRIIYRRNFDSTTINSWASKCFICYYFCALIS